MEVDMVGRVGRNPQMAKIVLPCLFLLSLIQDQTWQSLDLL